MNITYYGTRISEHITRRDPEGYLICTGVPVARTGVQEYLPEELDLPPCAGMIPVHREESEVFSPATMASFEGMPVTDDHPDDPDGVTAENAGQLQRGHAHNVRRGTGDLDDLLLADLIITDPVLIGRILAGKREISCGYNYELEERDGAYYQRRIRGNHIAVVDAGRAGHRVAIRDRRPDKERSKTQMTNKPNWMHKFLARYAKDAPEEEVAEVLAEIMEENTAEPEPETDACGEPREPETDACRGEEQQDEETEQSVPAVPGIEEKLDRAIALLEQLTASLTVTADEENVPAEEIPAEPETDPLEAVILEAMEDEEEMPADIVEEIAEEAAEEQPDPMILIEARDRAIRAAVMAVKPALAAMDEKTRQKTAREIARRLRTKNGTDTVNGYAALRRAADRGHADGKALGQAIMAKRNCNV